MHAPSSHNPHSERITMSVLCGKLTPVRDERPIARSAHGAACGAARGPDRRGGRLAPALLALVGLSACPKSDDLPDTDPIMAPAPTPPPEASDAESDEDAYVRIRDAFESDPAFVRGAGFDAARSRLRTIANEADDSHLRANASLLLGAMLEARGEGKAAIDQYRHAARLVTDDAGPVMALALALAADEQYAEAAKAQARAAELIPTTWRTGWRSESCGSRPATPRAAPGPTSTTSGGARGSSTGSPSSTATPTGSPRGAGRLRARAGLGDRRGHGAGPRLRPEDRPRPEGPHGRGGGHGPAAPGALPPGARGPAARRARRGGPRCDRGGAGRGRSRAGRAPQDHGPGIPPRASDSLRGAR